MTSNKFDSGGPSSATSTYAVLLSVGIAGVLFAAVFAGRIVWEETALTWQFGPQMIGFSLAHGAGVVLFLAPLLLALWILIAGVIAAAALFRKKKISITYWSCLASAILVLGICSVPSIFWQWLFVGSFAKSEHAPALMVYAAAEGDVRTVRAYLAAGVPLESHNYEGSTAAFTAASSGNVPVLETLTAKGADLNAVNSYGDSPLEAAVENHQGTAADFLKAHGATQIRGTKEQRDAASMAIVRRDIDRLSTR